MGEKTDLYKRIGRLEACIAYAHHCLLTNDAVGKACRPDTALAALRATGVEPSVQQPTGIYAAGSISSALASARPR
jgi:hypothetical protein